LRDAASSVHFDAAVARDDDGGLDTLSLQCRGESFEDIGEAACLGERGGFGGNHQYAHPSYCALVHLFANTVTQFRHIRFLRNQKL
jgi:hypothetical protein